MGATFALACVGETPSLDANSEAPPQREGDVRFVCISDTHNHHAGVVLPKGDVLLHTGDFSYYGTKTELQDFANWFASQDFKHKILIAGNHDIGMDDKYYAEIDDDWKTDAKIKTARENYPANVRDIIVQNPNFTYLEEQVAVVEGIKIYGSPFTNLIELPAVAAWFRGKDVGRMAFNLMNPEERRVHWSKIPEDTDILMTHMPPHGYRDGPMKFGSHELLSRGLAVKPLFHVFGHVHEGAGVAERLYSDDLPNNPRKTTFVNACSCTLRYRPSNPAIIFDIPRRTMS